MLYKFIAHNLPREHFFLWESDGVQYGDVPSKHFAFVSGEQPRGCVVWGPQEIRIV